MLEYFKIWEKGLVNKMRKLKYTLLFVMLIFGLNSCLTTMVGWGICEQYGCTPSQKKMESRE